jgi:ribonuclease E
MATEAETAQEAERAAARRRSTVREKVSFLVEAQPASPSPVSHGQPAEPAPAPVPPPAQPAPETTTDTQPRRAGWWSRRFGNGE